MNYKKICSGCCALALLIGLAGCGTQEEPGKAPAETYPAETAEAADSEETAGPDTLLAMELINNFLTMKKPRHESIQTRFGLLTAELSHPVVRYEDWSYTDAGEAALVNFGMDVVSTDTNGYRDSPDSDVRDRFLDGYLYPETVQWRDSLPYGHYDDWLDGVTFFFKNPVGEDTLHYGAGRMGYSPAADFLPAHYGFASLPKKSHLGFLQEAANDSKKAQKTFTLSENQVYDMAEKQKLYREYEEAAFLNPVSKETTLSYYHYMTLEQKPCYAVSYDIPQEYVSAFNGKLMDEVFCQIETVITTDANGDRYAEVLNEGEQQRHPVKMRLSPGMVHVSLYFDKESRQCIGQQMDLTDCAEELMDYLCTLNHVKAGDRSFIIETQYFDNSFQKIPDSLEHQTPEKRNANQIVFYAGKDQCLPDFPNDMEEFSMDLELFSLNHYEKRFDENTGLYYLTENGEPAALMEVFAKDTVLEFPEEKIRLQGEEIKDFFLREQGNDSQECRTPMGITYTFCKSINMFPTQDWDPEAACMGISLDEKTGSLCCIYAENQDKIESVLEDLNWKEEMNFIDEPIISEIPEDMPLKSSPHHQIFSTHQYDVTFNRRTGLYEISDETSILGILQKNSYCPELDSVFPEQLISQNGLTYFLYEIPMGTLFGDKDPNPSEIGCMASFKEDGTDAGFLLSAWDRETAVKIMEDITFTTEVMPNFWEIQEDDQNFFLPEEDMR